MTWSLNDIISDVQTGILHPEFGTIYQEPDGEVYLAYQAGLTEGRAEHNREKKVMSENSNLDPAEYQDAPAHPEGLTPYASDTSYHVHVDPRPMTKTEIGVVAGLVVTIVGAFGWLIRADIKAQEKRHAEYKAETEERDRKAAEARAAREAWFTEQRTAGRIVFETRDGSWMAIPADAYKNSIVKKKGEWA